MGALGLALVLALALGACGDDGGGGAADAVPGDTSPGDTSPGDTSPGDSSPGDTSAGDTLPGDTSPGDTSAGDTSPGDTSPGDTSAGDTGPGPAAVVVVNEIHASGDPADWIELTNAGDAPAALAGWTLTDDDPLHVYVFPVGTSLAPGAYLLVENDPEAGFDFGLGDTDAAALYDGGGALVDRLEWDLRGVPNSASFGRIPDGTGEALPLETPTPGAANQANAPTTCGNDVAEFLELCDGDDVRGLTCDALAFAGGTLGCAEGCEALDTSGCNAPSQLVVVNEVSSSGDDPIELYNPGASAVDLSGWRVTDENDRDLLTAYLFATGTSLGPGAFLVLTKGPDHLFGLGGSDEVRLRNAAGVLVDAVQWSSGQADVSFCRVPDGTGVPAPCSVATFGSPNVP